MQQESNPYDPAEWGPGPWQGEPNELAWRDLETGLRCIAWRNPMGSWCGYVEVPAGHPHHGLGYDDFDYDVHGGLTFGDHSAELDAMADPGPTGSYWIGFDCSHANDLIPAMTQLLARHKLRTGERYRDLNYVRAQCTLLASQVAAKLPGADFLISST